MAMLVILIPLFGYLGDNYGARKIFQGLSIGFILFSIPLYLLIVYHPSLTAFALLQFVFSILLSAAYGTLPVTVVSIFPKNLRYTATGLSFNISVAAFGGTAPFIITKLIETTKILWIPGVALFLVGIVSFISVSKLNKNYLNEQN